MKEYLAYIVAAGALSCATTQSAKEDYQVKPVENYQVKPVVMHSARDCSNLPPKELIDCITEEEDTLYAPAPTPAPYTVTPKVVKTACDPNLSGEEMLKCIMEEEDEEPSQPLQ